MTEEENMQLALFKFSILGPVLNKTFPQANATAYFHDVCQTSYTRKSGKIVKYSEHTMRRWYRDYRLGGFDSLLTNGRVDKGNQRVLTLQQQKQIQTTHEQFPKMTTTHIYQQMLKDGQITRDQVSLSTFHRFVRKLPKTPTNEQQRLAYEMTFANQGWQADTCYFPSITVSGKKHRLYLICIVDDASRLIVHAQLFFADNSLNFQHCLKKAIGKYGVPAQLYVDNGAPYRNEQLSLICATLGLTLIHAKPRSPQGKGKQERLFRTIQEGFVYTQDFSHFTSLEHVNAAFLKYLEAEYLSKPHSALAGKTPTERFLEDFSRVKRISSEQLDLSFLHRVKRRVHADSTIRLQKQLLEVPYRFSGLCIHIRYQPDDLKMAYIYSDKGEYLETISLVKKTDNAKRKRTPIDYTIYTEDKTDA